MTCTCYCMQPDCKQMDPKWGQVPLIETRLTEARGPPNAASGADHSLLEILQVKSQSLPLWVDFQPVVCTA